MLLHCLWEECASSKSIIFHFALAVAPFFLAVQASAQAKEGVEMNLPRPISSQESPRQIIAQDFKIDLPISGGWGYTKEDAVIIDANDPTVPKRPRFNGVNIEYIFVEKRIYEEMIVFRPKGEQFSGIEWKLIEQSVQGDGKRTFDHLRFEITALPDRDWDELKAEWEGPNGIQNPSFDQVAHLRKRQQKTVRLVRDFWFDITSFFGR